jgi:hypothetical protein
MNNMEKLIAQLNALFTDPEALHIALSQHEEEKALNEYMKAQEEEHMNMPEAIHLLSGKELVRRLKELRAQNKYK